MAKREISDDQMIDLNEVPSKKKRKVNGLTLELDSIQLQVLYKYLSKIYLIFSY